MASMILEKENMDQTCLDSRASFWLGLVWKRTDWILKCLGSFGGVMAFSSKILSDRTPVNE